ncbi:MAG: transcriptional regulator, AraC family, partial [Rhizobacter sp.]|nr:transcriptional regulator, AraC family [Rhizobacter sp.]
LSLPLASQAGQLFSHLRHATLLQAACATPALLAGRASVQLFAGLENAMLQALLMFQPSTVHEALHAVHAVPQRAPVRRAIDFIDAQLQQPLTVTDLALQAGVSVRALQLGFQQELGVSPMTFVMQRRLERIRTELQQPHPHTTVTGTAHDWAMPHLGEFAKRYRARFGEAPSMTLRRSRGG